MILLIGLLAFAVGAPGWFWVIYWIIFILKTVSIALD
jgi:hypothetical protein